MATKFIPADKDAFYSKENMEHLESVIGKYEMSKFEQLADMIMFQGIEKENIGLLLGCLGSYPKTYEKGEYIAFENDAIKNIGFVIRGSVHMVKEDVWGNTTILARMTRGHLFGESFACGSDETSTVVFLAAENVEVLWIPFDRVMSTCCNSCAFHQQIIKNMVIMLSNKNQALMEKIEVVSKKSLREKILSYLSQEAQKHGSKYFEIPLGRIELADYLCTDRSALTRELGKMRAEGLIDYDKNVFRICE